MSKLKEAVRLLGTGDWEAAHPLVQEDGSRLGCWAHGIVHLLEGDLSNAGYWYRRAGRTPPDPSRAGQEIEELRAAIDTA